MGPLQDGGLARVTRQLLLSGDDPAARLRALMPLELGIFGLGDLAQPVLVRDFLNTLTLMSGHAYPAAVLRHHAYYLLRAASFSRRSFTSCPKPALWPPCAGWSPSAATWPSLPPS